MKIEYRKIKEINKQQLQDLFLSVKWSSGNYPDKLQIAIKNSHKVYTAWSTDKGVEKLVGLINALSDGVMTAYFHYLLVHPSFQSQGIGKQLMNLMLTEYKGYARKLLIAYDEGVKFYEQCGFKPGKNQIPMFITYLTT